MIEVNCLGLLYCTHYALPLIRDGGGGDIVNVSSVAGRIAALGSGVYNMTKWGVVGFSESLRQEGAHIGVRVTCVEPGFVETELQGHNTNPMVVERIEKMQRGRPARCSRPPTSPTRSSTPSRPARSTSRSTRSSCGPSGASSAERPTVQAYVITYAADDERDGDRDGRGRGRGSRRCARRWTSRCATSPSAAASRRRCSRRSSAARPARRWPSPSGSPAGLELTLSQLLRLDERAHVVVIRAGERRAARARGGHRTEELTPPLPGQRADVSLHTLEPGAATGRAGDPPLHEPGRRETAVVLAGAVSLLIDDERHDLADGRQRHLRRRPSAPLRERAATRPPSSSPSSPPGCGEARGVMPTDDVRQDLGGPRGRRRADLHRPAPRPRGHLAAGLRRPAARGPQGAPARQDGRHRRPQRAHRRHAGRRG